MIENFFLQAAPQVGLYPKDSGRGERIGDHIYRVGRIPRSLEQAGERLEPRFGRLARNYGRITFDKAILTRDATLEWVTPGHPLFEAVREEVLTRAQNDLRGGAVFYDLHRKAAFRLDVFKAAISDGRNNLLHQGLFVIETGLDGKTALRQPTIFQDITPAPAGTNLPDDVLMLSAALPGQDEVEQILVEQALQPVLDEITGDRKKQVAIVSHHMEISLNAIIDRVQRQFAELEEQRLAGSTEMGLEGRFKQMEDRLDELNARLENRQVELKQETHCMISNLELVGRAWVLPHPERLSPGIAPMVRDDEIERIAVAAATQYEESRGWVVESVEKDNRGFDLISRRMHLEDPQTAVELRFIEVKGRAGVGEIALSDNEYKTAQRLKDDYWLYVVFNCATAPELRIIRNPAHLNWKPVVRVEHYLAGVDQFEKKEAERDDHR